MSQLVLGSYRARYAVSAEDLARALALRGRRFRGGRRGDADLFDVGAEHLVVEDAARRVVACARLRRFADGRAALSSYAARRYDLAGLARRPGPLGELGRLCTAEGAADPAIIRLVRTAIVAWATAGEVNFLFGCATLPGIDPAAHAPGLALLATRHLAPPSWRPGVKAPAIVALPRAAGGAAEGREGLRAMPPLLRFYLGLGGRVSDHAVIDADLDALHVFAGLDLADAPPGRLRAIAAGAGREGEGAAAP